jgi:deoxyribodipyrimidine photo-lyase
MFKKMYQNQVYVCMQRDKIQAPIKKTGQKAITPSDFINANMIELKQTGFMSNEDDKMWRVILQQTQWIGRGAAYSVAVIMMCHSNWGNWAYLAE